MPETLDRLDYVLARVGLRKTTWWEGVSTGRFPQPIRIGKRAVAWRRSDIDALIERLAAEAYAPKPGPGRRKRAGK
jgi:prophage regulatory protein